MRAFTLWSHLWPLQRPLLFYRLFIHVMFTCFDRILAKGKFGFFFKYVHVGIHPFNSPFSWWAFMHGIWTPSKFIWFKGFNQQLFPIIFYLFLCCCKVYIWEYNIGLWCCEVVNFGKAFWWHLTNISKWSFILVGEQDHLFQVSWCIFNLVVLSLIRGCNQTCETLVHDIWASLDVHLEWVVL